MRPGCDPAFFLLQGRLLLNCGPDAGESSKREPRGCQSPAAR